MNGSPRLYICLAWLRWDSSLLLTVVSGVIDKMRMKASGGGLPTICDGANKDYAIHKYWYWARSRSFVSLRG